MSSMYSVLDNRPIDQWKVTELREELKKRKLTTKGLKEDLVKRLDESIRSENESVEVVAETTKDIAESADNRNEKLDGAIQVDINDSRDSLDKEKNVKGQLIGDTDPAGVEVEQVVQAASVETSIMVSENVVSEITLSGHDLQTNKTQNETGDSNTVDIVAETTTDTDLSDNRNEKLDGAIQVDINDSRDSLDKEENVEGQLIGGTDPAGVEVEQGVQAPSVGTSIMVSESVVTDITLSEHDLQTNKTQNETGDSKTVDIVAETTMDVADLSDNINEKLDDDIQVDINNSQGSLDKEKNAEGQLIGDTDPAGGEVEQVVEATSVETSIMVSESVVSEVTLSGNDLQNNKTQNETGDSKHQPKNEDLEPQHEDAKLNSSDPCNQVSEVSPVLGFSVKSDSISTDSVSINEKNELKDNVIADDDKLELDVKPEVVLPLSSNAISDGGLQPLDVGEPHENKESIVKTGDSIAENADMGKKNNSGDVGSPEKLNLDRSSGDDSMEEDVSECKQIDSKFSSNEVGDKGDRPEVPVVEERPIGVTRDALPAYQKKLFVENKNGPALSKRKLHDPEKVANNDTTKRQRRWNSEGLKFPDAQSIDVAPSPTPKDTFQRRRNLSRSDSMSIDEAPKEREVPPSSMSPTNSLRIDRFLRPFTLKAVQELLAKTGNVTGFWMDNIKTHCYVTYSSIEEAVETRNAVYNVQWPPNGGRLLVAEFVDPHEVKKRVEVPQSPTTPVSTGPTISAAPPSLQPQPSPRQQVQRQKLPSSPPLPPPPPLSNPPPVRERLTLPPPPPLPEKVDPPIVTLDDLFRKTKATPRIYYLPLSDEQVAAKPKTQGKNAKLYAGFACRKELFRPSWCRRSWFVDGLGFFRGLIWFEAYLKFVLEVQKTVFFFLAVSFHLWSLFAVLRNKSSNFLEQHLFEYCR